MATSIVAIIGVVTIALALVSAAVLFRLVVVRGNGTAALMRHEGAEKWRYGSIHYSASGLGYYRLVSLRFRPDVVMPRATLAVGSWRTPTETEFEVAEPGEIILPVSGRDSGGRELSFDLCLGRREATALLSWVEACSTEDVRVRGKSVSKRRRR